MPEPTTKPAEPHPMAEALRRFGPEGLLLGLGLVSAAITGLLAIPVMARSLDPSIMAVLSLFFVGWALLGIMDCLRPVLIPSFKSVLDTGARVGVGRSVKSATGLGILVAFSSFLLLRYAFPTSHPPRGAFPLLSVAIGYFAGVPFWSLLDATHRVGLGQLVRSLSTVSLYAGFALGSLANWPLPAFLWWAAIVTSLASTTWAVLSRNSWQWSEGPDGSWRLTDAWYTLRGNAAKLWSDAIDRVLFGRFWPPTAFVAYASLYDLTAKVNLVPQYGAAISYPLLCAQRHGSWSDQSDRLSVHERRVLRAAVLIYAVISIGGLIVAPWSDMIIRLYLGPAYSGHGHLVLLLAQVTAVYSLAFFTQALLRANGRFRSLQKILWSTALAGTLVGLAAWLRLGVAAAAVGILVMKAPGLPIAVAYLRRDGQHRVAWTLLGWCALTTAGVAVIFTGSFSGGLFVVLGLIGVLVAGRSYLTLRVQ